jgi:lipopolysaccharide transport system ATP-binding protein
LRQGSIFCEFNFFDNSSISTCSCSKPDCHTVSEVIVSAEGVSKRYMLDHQLGVQSYRKFSDVLVNAAKTPWRWLRGQPSKTKSVEEFWALKDVSFEIRRGEVMGIVGRNGAGKSTLLKLLSRISEPTQGRITLRGRVASLLEVGTGFHPELSGRENIFLNGAILGMSRSEIRSKFDEIVDFAEVEQFLDTPVKRYSSGMYVRLAFAVAAHLEPEILIVDEVLAVGDAQFQAKCLGKMQDVSKGDGRTVIFVSHNMAAVRSLCRTGILLERGKVVKQGSMDEVIDLYVKQGPATQDFKANKNPNSYVTGCEIRGAQGCAELFFTNDVLQVSVRYRNERKINGLRAGFNITLSDGTILATCTPEDEGYRSGSDAGEHEIVGTLVANQLLKGLHKVDAAVWNGTDNTIYDFAKGANQFTLEAARERAYTMESTRPGMVQIPVHWAIKKISD